jgi:hypothetical protein
MSSDRQRLLLQHTHQVNEDMLLLGPVVIAGRRPAAVVKRGVAGSSCMHLATNSYHAVWMIIAILLMCR